MKQKNRKLLIECMQKIGFENYSTEWWHWSYGDCYWGFLNDCDAFYAPVEKPH